MDRETDKNGDTDAAEMEMFLSFVFPSIKCQKPNLKSTEHLWRGLKMAV